MFDSAWESKLPEDWKTNLPGGILIGSMSATSQRQIDKEVEEGLISSLLRRPVSRGAGANESVGEKGAAEQGVAIQGVAEPVGLTAVYEAAGVDISGFDGALAQECGVCHGGYYAVRETTEGRGSVRKNVQSARFGDINA